MSPTGYIAAPNVRLNTAGLSLSVSLLKAAPECMRVPRRFSYPSCHLRRASAVLAATPRTRHFALQHIYRKHRRSNSIKLFLRFCPPDGLVEQIKLRVILPLPRGFAKTVIWAFTPKYSKFGNQERKEHPPHTHTHTRIQSDMNILFFSIFIILLK